MEPSNQSSDAVGSAAEDNLLRNPQLSSNSRSNKGPRPLENPLLNPVILDLIVEHLDPNFDQLKKLRLVSKVWTKATQHRWRKSCAVLTIVPNPPSFSKSSYETGVSVSIFMKEFQDPQSPFQLSEKPFSKYKLKDFTMDLELCRGGGGGPDSSAYKFWKAIGPLMESVHFYRCLFERPEDSFDSNTICPRVQFLVGIIPNLKDLVLTDMTYQETEKYYQDEFSNEDVLSEDDFEKLEILKAGEGRSPHLNLRTLTIYGDLKRNNSLIHILMFAPGVEVIKGLDQRLKGLLQPIHRVRYHPTAAANPRLLSNLKIVDLAHSRILNHGHFPVDSANPIEGVPVGSQVPLEILSVNLGSFYGDTENLDIYLESLASTLKTFRGYRAPLGPPYSTFLSNASMAVLTELQLMGTIAPNFGFLKSTPNLKKLRIDLGCFERRKELKDKIRQYNEDLSENWKHEKFEDDMVLEVAGNLKDGILCTELEHLEIDFEFPGESLRLLGKWMPNLKVLKTILNMGTVPVVCEIWNELRELVCMYGSEMENHCFIRADEKIDADDLVNSSEMKICDLKALERFQLDAYCDDCKLSDDAVYKGLLKMTGLKCVELCVNSQMSVEAEEALRKGIQFCKVVRDDHDVCGGSASFANSFYLCERCAFRDEVIYGIGRNDEDDDMSGSEESEEDSSDAEIVFRGGPRLVLPRLQLVDSGDDEDSSSSSSN